MVARGEDVNISEDGTAHPCEHWLRRLRISIALALWMGGFHFNMLWTAVGCLFFPRPWAVLLLALQVAFAFLPIDETSPWGLSLARWICKEAPQHFPIRVKFEAKEALDPDKPHVVAVEPHSVLPLGLMMFSQVSDCMPWKKKKVLASSAVYSVPLVRHLWSWFGMAPVSRPDFARLLATGHTCVLVPGGVSECLYMERNQEVVFLKQRRGFIRMALAAGAPVVPVFVFGQNRSYHWWRPRGRWFAKLSQLLRFSPLVFWGMFGSPLPLPEPMLIVVGKPIPVEKTEEPTAEQVALLQSKYIAAMEELHERHKKEGGDEHMKLIIK